MINKLEQRLYRVGVDDFFQQEAGISIPTNEPEGGTGGGKPADQGVPPVEGEKPAETPKGDEGGQLDIDALSGEELNTKIDELKAKGDTLSVEEKGLLDQMVYKTLPLIDKIKSSYDYEELADKTYSNDDEGFRQLSVDIATVESQRLLSEIHNASPLLSELYDHVVNKGLSEELFEFKYKKPDYASLDLKSEDGQKQILSFYYKEKGIGEDEANAIISSLENQGNLAKKAISVKSELDKMKQEQVAQKEQQEIQERARQENLQKETAKQVGQVLKKGEVLGVKLSSEELNQFKNHIEGVNEQGVPIRIDAYNKATVEQKMFIDLLLMKGFKIGNANFVKETKKLTFDQLQEENRNRKPASGGGRTFTPEKRVNLIPNDIDLSKAKVLN